MNEIIIATTNFVRVNDSGNLVNGVMVWIIYEFNPVVVYVDGAIRNDVWIDERFQE